MKLFTFSGGRRPHKNNLPTMTVVIPQLSLETIFRDYCRGVLHPELSSPGMYDPDDIDDDDFDFVNDVEDISELVSSEPAPKVPINDPEESPEPPKPEESPAE